MDLQEEFNKLDLQKCFVGGLLALGVFWVMFYDNGSGIDAQLAQVRQQIQQNERSLQQVRQTLEDKKRFEEEIETIILNMKDFQKYFSDDMDINALQARVSQLSEQFNIELINMKPVERSSEFADYKEIAVDFQVEGPFHNVMEFVSGLTKMEKAIDFSSMKMETTVTGDYPIISLTTTLVVYSSTETAEDTSNNG
jgi:Tfp pilus assembly protein PilO